MNHSAKVSLPWEGPRPRGPLRPGARRNVDLTPRRKDAKEEGSAKGMWILNGHSEPHDLGVLAPWARPPAKDAKREAWNGGGYDA